MFVPWFADPGWRHVWPELLLHWLGLLGLRDAEASVRPVTDKAQEFHSCFFFIVVWTTWLNPLICKSCMQLSDHCWKKFWPNPCCISKTAARWTSSVSTLLSAENALTQWRCLTDLGGLVGVSSLAQQQAGHLGVSFLGRQVQRADSLLGQNVGLRSVLHQRQGDVHLVLFGGNVERRVSVLESEKEGTVSCRGTKGHYRWVQNSA